MKPTPDHESSSDHEDLLIEAARREVLGGGSVRTPETTLDGASPVGDHRDGGLTETAFSFQGPRHGRIARYHVKRVIASGGMGTVYEATQHHPRRTVAIKVMKHGVSSRRALRRFEYEAQILARLHHPGIAHVYEAGWHNEGNEQVPFFAMEYIPNARSLLDWARNRNLRIRDRLELFIGVCQAVHHGHQRGIIHRDLKPGNILIDAQGQVKIIDFGVARSTDADLNVTTLQTSVGEMVGTLRYMSPEQCQADPHDLDIRSDIYSLGVLLFELLAGKMPYDLYSPPIAAAPNVICEEPPTRLGSVDRALRGDIETIVNKTLEKDRKRRYQSALALSEDIQRFLNDEPILARPPSAVYRLRKLVKRRRKPFALAVVLALAGFAVGATITTSFLAQVEQTRLENEWYAERLERQRLANDVLLMEALSSTWEFEYRPSQRRRVMKTCDEAIKLDETNARAYALRAKIHVLDGHYDLAGADCAKAFRLDPNDLLALRTCAFVSQFNGEFEVALAQYERAMGTYSYTDILPRDFHNRGRMRRIAGDYEGALQDCNIAAALAPENGLVLRGRGITKYMMGDIDGAIEDLEEAAKYLESRVVTLYLWIWEMRMLRDAPGDRAAASKAFNLAEEAAAAQELAVGLMAMWHGERTVKEHLDSLTEANDRAQVHYFVGIKALVAGRKDEAVAHFRQAVDPPVLYQWGEFELARWHLQRLTEH